MQCERIYGVKRGGSPSTAGIPFARKSGSIAKSRNVELMKIRTVRDSETLSPMVRCVAMSHTAECSRKFLWLINRNVNLRDAAHSAEKKMQ
jgi:hypothetical protein